MNFRNALDLLRSKHLNNEEYTRILEYYRDVTIRVFGDSTLPKEIISYEQIDACSSLFQTCSQYAANILGVSEEKLCEDLEQTYIKKNHDYGNSWTQMLDRFGLVCMQIRMYEKLNRVITLLGTNRMVMDEGISDTLCDICNYSVMTAMWIENSKKLTK